MAKSTTRYTFLFDEGTERILLTSLRIVVIIKTILFLWNNYERLKQDKDFIKKIAVLFFFATALRLVYYKVYCSDKYSFLLFLSVLIIGAIGTDYRRIMKLHTIAVGLLIGSAVISSLCGLIVNNAYLQDGVIRSTWGILSPTDFGAIIIYLCIIAWIAWREISAGLFVFLGSISLLNSIFIARSNTSTIMSVLFLITIILEGISFKKCRKLIACFVQCLFPALSLVTFGMIYLYHRGTTIGIKLDQFFHNRLALTNDGLMNYKISLFGKPFTQIGFGGSTFYKSGYNFIDSSYVLILLRYGVVLFFALMILWVIMTRKAIKMGHWRLAFGMALIAINSFSEHHFMEIQYNILIILPFSVLSMGWLIQDKAFEPHLNKKIRFAAGFVTGGITSLFILVFGPRILSIFRTIIDLTNDDFLKRKEMLICMFFMLMIVLVFSAIIALNKLLRLLIDKCIYKKISIRKKLVFPFSVLVIITMFFIAGTFVGNRIINKKGALFINCLDLEKIAIEAVERGINISDGYFFTDVMPSIYKKRFGKISESFFQGDEFAERLNTTVLIDADYESSAMLKMGFLYTEISDEHALYTNDSEVIRELESVGYHLTGYFSRNRVVDMKEQAELNELDMTSFGAIKVVGLDKPIWRGPFYDLRGGVYSILYDMSLSEVNTYNEDYKICTLKITARRGTDTIVEVPVYRTNFDENGNYIAKVRINISDCEACEFKLYAESGQTILLNGVSCQKTPDMDLHREVDRKGRVIRLSYYDLKGNKIEISDGYHAVEYEYDKKGNISQYWYLDDKGDLVITEAGYAGIARKYDIRKRVIKETYYGQNHEKLKLESGQSSIAYKYDKNGNIVEYRYYDDNDKLTMHTNGYAILRRSFDEKSLKCVYEAYFDMEDTPVFIADGYASVRYSYDEDGKEYYRCFYDDEVKPVVTSYGYAERKRIYDAGGRLVLEEYYDADGDRMTFDTGVSIVEYEYDLYGNQADIYYYDADCKPVMRNGEYHHLCRVYNSKGQIIREMLFDSEGNPIIRDEGFAIREMGYDEYGNTSIYRFLDKEGKSVMRTDGYSEQILTFNDKKQVIKVEYYGVTGEPVIIPDGYSKVEYKYDASGNQTDLIFFDGDGKPTLYWGVCYGVHQTFNDNNQLIRKDYLDASGKVMMRSDNFASIEITYDSAGNLVEQDYLDLSNNLTANSYGYAVLCREYDSANHMTKEYYLDDARTLVDCVDGYAMIVNTYDDFGDFVSKVCYNTKGEIVE